MAGQGAGILEEDRYPDAHPDKRFLWFCLQDYADQVYRYKDRNDRYLFNQVHFGYYCNPHQQPEDKPGKQLFGKQGKQYGKQRKRPEDGITGQEPGKPAYI